MTTYNDAFYQKDDEDFKQFYSTQLDLFTKQMEEEQKDAEESKIEINELSKNINVNSLLEKYVLDH